MQHFLVQWTFESQEIMFEASKDFVRYVEEGCPDDHSDEIDVVYRVKNPAASTGWVIIRAASHEALWKWSQPWVKKFSQTLTITPVITDAEFCNAYRSQA